MNHTRPNIDDVRADGKGPLAFAICYCNIFARLRTHTTLNIHLALDPFLSPLFIPFFLPSLSLLFLTQRPPRHGRFAPILADLINHLTPSPSHIQGQILSYPGQPLEELCNLSSLYSRRTYPYHSYFSYFNSIPSNRETYRDGQECPLCI